MCIRDSIDSPVDAFIKFNFTEAIALVDLSEIFPFNKDDCALVEKIENSKNERTIIKLFIGLYLVIK